MTDLIALAETTARDPLVGAFALMAVGALVSLDQEILSEKWDC
jgi:hypothetical protein